MQLTLLEIVQAVLSDINSDEVNSIDDTFESERVAIIARDTYYYLASSKFLPHYQSVFQLGDTGDATLLTHTTIPDDVIELYWITYNKTDDSGAKKYTKIDYAKADAFLDLINQRDSTDTNVTTVTDPSGIELLIRTDQQPTIWTSFDDHYVVFDAHDSTYDDTIMASKTQCHGLLIPSWSHLDSSVPDVPEKYFSYYLTEVKAACAAKIKQALDPVEEERKTRNRMHLAARNAVAQGKQRYPNYGRRSSTTNWHQDNQK